MATPSCGCILYKENFYFFNRGDGHDVGCVTPRQSDPTREAVAKEVLGENPLVRMTDAACECEPWVAAAMASSTPAEARAMAEELKEDIAKKMPAWRGWGIEFREGL